MQTILSDDKPTTILLVNLGTPSKLEKGAIRRYLKEFLSDRRVIDINRLLWWPLLHGIILRLRPQKTIKSYAKIWDYAEDKSPLAVITASQASKLATYFGATTNNHTKIMVDWAMRYGEPSLDAKILNAIKNGTMHLIVVPLYPQYCAATTASICDKVFDSLKKQRYIPSLTITPPYYDNKDYIAALAEPIKKYLQQQTNKPDKIIASYHGIPERYVRLGDPYYEHCKRTSALITKHLSLPDNYLLTSFQSRFGREIWLKPYTDILLRDLPAQGSKSVMVFCPGFATDCIETLEEIDISYRQLFLKHGGHRFDYISCLNDTENHIKFLHDFIKQYINHSNELQEHRLVGIN